MTCVTFTPDGRGSALYTEAIDLAALGALSITRATTIEFDNTDSRWVVRDPGGRALFHNPSRQACLDWEHDYLQIQEDQTHAL